MKKIINYLENVKIKYLYSILFIFLVITLILVYFLLIKEPIIKEVKVEAKTIKNEVKPKSVKVDIKGAILNPGVYELDEGARVIDVINIAGGLLENADTSVINLSKNLSDEMTIIIYTYEEILAYQNENKKIEYVYIEVPICPDNINQACIKESERTTKKENASKIDIKENKLISLNNATKEELMTLSGIGESKALDIIAYRTENSFKTIEDLMNVKGIGTALFEKIKNNITV